MVRSCDQARWEQRVGAFAKVPDILVAMGVDPQPVLAAAGLTPEQLANPGNRIAYDCWSRLLQHAAIATGQPNFGLLAGRLWHLSDLGPVGEAAGNCATVGEALELLTVHQHRDSCGGMTFLLKHGPVVDFGYAIYCPEVSAPQYVYDSILAAYLNYVRDLAGNACMPTQVLIPYSAPGYRNHLENLFKVRPNFNAELCALRFPAHWLDRSVPNADALKRRAAVEAMSGIETHDLLERTYRAVRMLLLEGRTSGDDLAQMLDMHRRTLNRRLKQRGTTFQRVLDGVRLEVARQLLLYADTPLDDIAASLGYAGLSPFMRSFKRWTGSSPSRWRGGRACRTTLHHVHGDAVLSMSGAALARQTPTLSPSGSASAIP